MDAEMRRRIDAARAQAVPIPWRPPVAVMTLGPELVHQHLVAELVVRQLRGCQQLLDGVGLHGLAWETRHLANLVETAAEITRRVAA